MERAVGGTRGRRRLNGLGLARRAGRPASRRIDLAIDLQGDVRASLLLWLSGAQRRVGYANTGGEYLLTQVMPLDETVSWVEQNRRAVSLAPEPLSLGRRSIP